MPSYSRFSLPTFVMPHSFLGNIGEVLDYEQADHLTGGKEDPKDSTSYHVQDDNQEQPAGSTEIGVSRFRSYSSGLDVSCKVAV